MKIVQFRKLWPRGHFYESVHSDDIGILRRSYQTAASIDANFGAIYAAALSRFGGARFASRHRDMNSANVSTFCISLLNRDIMSLYRQIVPSRGLAAGGAPILSTLT